LRKNKNKMIKATFLALAGVVAANQSYNVTLNNGIVMPLLTIGTWQYNASTAYDELKKAFSVGFRHVDTAHDYNDQVGVGRAWAEGVAEYGRENLFLTTKVPGCGTQGVRSGANCGPDTLKAVNEDFAQLNVSQVDLMLLHFPGMLGCGTLGCPEIQTQWAVMEQLYAENKARAIGVSNYCPSCFECLFKASKQVPMVNQIEYHVGMGPDPIGLRSYMREKNIQMQAYSPLGDGSSELINGALVSGIGKTYNKSGAQVSLKWVMQQNIGLLTKADTMQYLQEDADMFSWDLSDSDMATLTKATKPSGNPSFRCTK